MYSLRLGPHPIVVLHGLQALKDALCGQAVNFGGRGRLPIMDNALRVYSTSPSRAAASPLLCGPQFCPFLWSMTFPRLLGLWQEAQLLHHGSIQPTTPKPTCFFSSRIPLHFLLHNMWLFAGEGGCRMVEGRTGDLGKFLKL